MKQQITNMEALAYIAAQELEREKRLKKFFDDRELDREYRLNAYITLEQGE